MSSSPSAAASAVPGTADATASAATESYHSTDRSNPEQNTKIKAEYLVEVPAAILAAQAAQEAAASAASAAAFAATTGTGPKADHFDGRDNGGSNDKVGGKRKFQNASQKRKDKLHKKLAKRGNVFTGPPEENLCYAVSRGEECYNKGTTCRFSHDFAAFMATKPKDLGSVCYSFQEYGFCQSGYKCRFANHHIDADGKLMFNEEAKAAWVNQQVNQVSMQVRKELQRQVYFDSRAMTFVSRKGKLVEPSAAEIAKGRARSAQVAPKTAPTAVVAKAEEVSSVVDAAAAPADAAATPVTAMEESSDVAATAVSEPVDAAPTPVAKVEEAAVSVATIKPVDTATPVVVKMDESSSSTATDEAKMGACGPLMMERKPLDFTDKVYVAPLTTVGNLPYRRLLKGFKTDVTCAEMALCTHLLRGESNEWALCRRHHTEDVFGLQIAGGSPSLLGNAARVIAQECQADFIDVNMGCPIDMVTSKGAGSRVMLNSTSKLHNMIESMTNFEGALPVGLKMRIGWNESKPLAHKLISKVQTAVTNGEMFNIAYFGLHGRTRAQRYTRRADWDYVSHARRDQVACANSTTEAIPFFGNGDVFSFNEWDEHLKEIRADIVSERMAKLDHEEANGEGEVEKERAQRLATQSPFRLTTCMLGRGALVKPWLATEIHERRHWDISATERFDMLKDFVNYGLEQWGSDERGVNTTRRYLLEWLSFLHRYVPVGLLESPPQCFGARVPAFCGRSDLETLLASPVVEDWIAISERLLGPVPDGFSFEAKHKAKAGSARLAVTSSGAIGGLGVTSAERLAVVSAAVVAAE